MCREKGQLKVVVWANFATHYQTSFFNALTVAGVDLKVIYYGAITADRLALGWEDLEENTAKGLRVNSLEQALNVLTTSADAVHIIPGYGSYITMFVAVAAAWRRIAWMHWSEPAHPGLRWWIDWPRKWLYAQLVNSRALGAFAIGLNAERDFLRWGIRASKIRQLPYSRCRETELARPLAKPGELVFGFTGALCPRKGIDLLIPAFGRLARRFPRTKLVLVGRNDFGLELEEMIKNSGAAARIEVYTPVAPEVVDRFLANMDVFVMPSRFDGWGLSLQEAALAGCALISTRMCGAALHLIHASTNGILIDGGDMMELMNAMAIYAANPEIAAKHAAASPRIAAAFTPEANARRLVVALGEILPKAGLSVSGHSTKVSVKW